MEPTRIVGIERTAIDESDKWVFITFFEIMQNGAQATMASESAFA